MKRLQSIEELDLLPKLQNGDQNAFTALYNKYSNRIYNMLFKLTQSQELTEELLQDTFIILWNKRSDIDPDQSVKSWLHKVAQNEVYQLYRKIARDRKLQEHVVLTFVESYSHTEEGIYYKESQELLEKAMSQLSPQRRQVFQLCRIDGHSYQQVAEIMGISVSTVSNHLVQATGIVRDYIFKSKERIAIIIAVLLCN
ncbi:RNA polymerase sigma-70 factor [Flavobacterium supellecticarium]|uniref:RNA polymerase sigma-70 factor n=1 Tax=Flavobacterium supellecticarium TaxID=2565924 RepID=A0A4S4A3J0_9FLAO|nr:RNA polymerase sigma-70 factor [Flavobacterium supellecticarium]THF52991.1 RNA polymerase sigma-70 factor [Flavobacterium supellecticarium]